MYVIADFGFWERSPPVIQVTALVNCKDLIEYTLGDCIDYNCGNECVNIDMDFGGFHKCDGAIKCYCDCFMDRSTLPSNDFPYTIVGYQYNVPAEDESVPAQDESEGG